jgi:hypothetical protein
MFRLLLAASDEQTNLAGPRADGVVWQGDECICLGVFRQALRLQPHGCQLVLAAAAGGAVPSKLD